MKTRRHNAAFTIVELLIAATITVLIVVMLGTMFSNLGRTTTRANQRTDTFREARAAIQMIERDFSCLVAATPAAYFASNPDQSNGSGSQARQLFGLISMKNKPSGGSAVAGDLCAVGYYCGWDGKSYRLLRFFNGSADSVVSGTTKKGTLSIFKDNLSTPPPTPLTLSYVGVGALYPLAATDEVVAANCWNLVVTAYDSNGTMINPVAYPNGGQTSKAYICDPNGSSNPLPAAIEVSFKAMSADAARSALASGASPAVWMAYDQNSGQPDKDKYDRLIRPNVYQFRTRISLK